MTAQPPPQASDDALVCLLSCPNDAVAGEVARTLVIEHLAACVNILPGVRSLYRWHDGIADEVEVLCLVKTTRERFEKLRARVVSLHPYDVPEVIGLPIAIAHEPYLTWLRESVIPIE
jgi:periplasmic divalent cation tolerance protein